MLFITNRKSESLVASLCKELNNIEVRIKSIKSSLMTCKNKNLFSRLQKELIKHKDRKLSIMEIARKLDQNYQSKELSIKFLLEISERSIGTL